MRDLDAHSWVEVWFPEYGWVQRDPTPAPGAAAQPAGGGARRGRARRLPARAVARRRAPQPARRGPRPGAGRWRDWTLLDRRRRRARRGARPAAHVRVAPPPAAPAARAAADGRVRARAAPRRATTRARGSRSRGWSAASRAGRARRATSARSASSATRAARCRADGRAAPRAPGGAGAGLGRAARVVGAAAAVAVDERRPAAATSAHGRRRRRRFPAGTHVDRRSCRGRRCAGVDRSPTQPVLTLVGHNSRPR